MKENKLESEFNVSWIGIQWLLCNKSAVSREEKQGQRFSKFRKQYSEFLVGRNEDTQENKSITPAKIFW